MEVPPNPHLAEVAIPVGAANPFTYLIPEELRGAIRPGHRVGVPLGRRKTHGYVVRVHAEASGAPARLRALGPPDPPDPIFGPEILDLTRWISDYYMAPWGEVLEAAAPRGRPIAARRKKAAAPPAEDAATDGEGASLTPQALEPLYALTTEQQAVFGELGAALDSGAFEVHLIHGVAGSGKTEVYLALADRVLRSGGSVLLLEPEIGIATQILDRVRRKFGDAAGLYHSLAGPSERRDTWERARRGDVRLVVGARSAVFVPLRDLRLVVIDEEHEFAYKQEESPRYHGRDAAIVRARAARALTVLGTATPSLEAWYNAHLGKFTKHTLASRYGERAFPRIHVVDLHKDPGLPESGRPIPLFSGLLVQKVLERLRAGEQTILFLNRRGHSPIVQCTHCGEMLHCAQCEVVLTYHRMTEDLRCHHCGLVQKEVDACPSCKEGPLFFGGVGTQKLEEKLAELFPRARLLRLDADSTRQKGSHGRHVRSMEQGEVDILLGTQMVTKGFDFPRVTLVGVLQADREMAVPELRASERAFQVLSQVAGRAGRGDTPGEVVFQTLCPENFVIQAAAANDYDRFAREELSYREALHYPPFHRMIHILFDGKVEENVRVRAEEAATHIEPRARRVGVTLLGPAPMFLTRLKGRFRWHFTLKGPSQASLHRLARATLERQGPPGTRGVRVHVDVDPIHTI